MTTSRRSLLPIAMLVALAACVGSVEKPPFKPPPEPPLGLRDIPWNLTKADVGKVAAVAEVGDEIVFFGSHGATILQGGAVSATVAGATDWRSATPIPAADGIGTWIVGVTTDGKLLRLRATGVFEDVTPRYGLASEHVRELLAVDQTVVFALDHGLAISDGKTVTRFDAAAGGVLAGGGGRLSWIEGGEVRALDLKTKTLTRYPLAGAAFVTIDKDGNLVAATKRTVWNESGGTLHLAYTSRDVDVGALVTAGPRVWVTLGTDLGALEAGIFNKTEGLLLDADTRLWPALNGDVWALSASGVHRYGRDPADLVRLDWENTMLPIFARICSNCHEPGGTANVDLSTYQAWRDHRAEIRKRIVDQRSMPPKTQAFSESDRDAIRAWLDRTP